MDRKYTVYEATGRYIISSPNKALRRILEGTLA